MNEYLTIAAGRRGRHTASSIFAAIACVTALAPAAALRAQAGDTTAEALTGSAAWRLWLLGTQINVIAQDLRPLHSPYAGPHSLRANGDSKISHAYGVYSGVQAGDRLQGYLDVEMVRGKGISNVTGLAGPTNGDVLRQGSADLGSGPYVARAFLRYTVPFADRNRDTLRRSADQIPAIVSATRIEIMAGKFALSDIFDLNRYANSTRQQFMNWGLFNNTAWDFAADTRGYTNGAAVAWIHQPWILRFGSFQMPRAANGNVFDSDLRRAHAENAELSITVPSSHTVIRLLGYMNHARMGSYADALAIARATGTTPDIVANDRPGRSKEGWGINLEQPLADGGETGAFARLGWNDGKNESFVFTEVDRHASAGVQVSGARWGRADDRFGIGAVEQGIAQAHRDYLADGGLGFLLGDGRLNYGPEQIVETYYRSQAGPYIQVGPDVQYIRNPGYNRDRGPATVLSFRANLRY